MISAAEWVAHARALISSAQNGREGRPAQINLRRAVSAAYYGLFHGLTTAGSEAFAGGGEALRFQAARAFSHTAMRKVCDAYVRSPTRPFAAGLNRLNERPSPPELIRVAVAFARLQEGRHAADYDLLVQFEFESAANFVRLAETALADLEAIRPLPETAVFLSALLLADRWGRRG